MVSGLILLSACGRPAEPVTITFFYLPACPTCPETAELEALAGELIQIGRDNSNDTVTIHNLSRAEGSQRLREMADEREVDVRRLHFPILFVNDDVIEGLKAVGEYMESRLSGQPR